MPLNRLLKSGTISANSVNADMDVTDSRRVLVTLQGTFVATVSFFASDDGTNFYPLLGTPSNSATGVTTATTTGAWAFDVTNYKTFRLGTTAYTSGTINYRENSYAINEY